MATMMTSAFPDADRLSKDMLKKALAANGLPEYGSKPQMLARLLGAGEKKKPGPKPKAAPKKKKSTSDALGTDPAEKAFYDAERPRLAAMGITGDTEQNNELKRRWAATTQPKNPTDVFKLPDMHDVVKLPTMLNPSQLVQLNYELSGIEQIKGKTLFVYKTKGAAQGVGSQTSGAAKDKKRKVSPVEPNGCDEKDGDDDEDEMDWPCEVMVDRLMKHAKRESMAALCEDFGIRTTGTKKQLAEALAEQCHYETDNDDDDNDDDDNDDDDNDDE